MGNSLRTLKGVGDKTEKLFFKLGIYDTDDLLHYYPRNYDAFEAPVDIAFSHMVQYAISSNCVEARQSVCLPWTNRTKAVPP